MQHFDAIVVLGTQPHYKTWKFPSYAYLSLRKAEQLRAQGVAPYICVSGDHALKYDAAGIIQPFKESDKQEEYLLSLGTPQSAILKEGVSRDTLSNFYYLKNNIFVPHGFHKLLFITTDFRIPRLQLIARKVLGSDYLIDYVTVEYDLKNIYKNEARTLAFQQNFLADMPDGDDNWLVDKFYHPPYYTHLSDIHDHDQDIEARLII